MKDSSGVCGRKACKQGRGKKRSALKAREKKEKATGLIPTKNHLKRKD